LTKNQFVFFDRFLVASTHKVLDVLETMFSLNIDGSDSGIRILPTDAIENMERLSSDPLFVISSNMTGEMQGSLKLVMPLSDFKDLGEALKPTLKLLFLSNPDADLSTLEDQTPHWMEDGKQSDSDDFAFLEQMIDTSTELGNVLFGIYTDAIYKVYDLHTRHSLPEFAITSDQQYISDMLSSSALLDKQHLVIENNFSLLNGHFGLWCLISPSKKSFQVMLDRVG
jgi:chemotaxis protein CheY-P-specific phosphatase CheC